MATSSSEHVIDDSNNAANGDTTPASVPMLLTLPVPSIITPGKRLYYGFDVTEEWLLSYAKEHWRKFYPYGYGRADDGALATSGIRMLRVMSGVENLTFAMGMPNETSAEHGTETQGFGPERDMVTLLAVCSSRRASYDRRPTQEELERLEAVIGWPARWWIDYESDY
ncbi:hypothetical protein Hypma_000262 [Hypsizygus marmoreus]|uniref:Uncharacterized protein n=1 Tax=Hypsizygus marmoreus TaxID=39966 RepID=A0A369J9J8_HYPMA|nr:hypothetical protein Hypma_000262 [Hypsizygus marmoreus]